MKTIIATFLTAFVASAAQAQVEKGAWMLSANSNLGYASYSSKSSSTNTSVFSINSRAGYFVAKNLAFGVNLGYLSLSQTTSSSYTTLGIFSRCFLGKGVYLGAGFNSASASGSSASYTTYPLELGFAGFITKNFAIEPSIVYIASGDTGGVPLLGLPTSSDSAFGFNVGFTLYLGRPSEP